MWQPEHRKTPGRGTVQTPNYTVLLDPFPKTEGSSAYDSSVLSPTKEMGVQGQNGFFGVYYRIEREANLAWYFIIANVNFFLLSGLSLGFTPHPHIYTVTPNHRHNNTCISFKMEISR